MSGFGASQALDVAIGLVLMFALLSVVCSALNETIATVLSWRSEFLERGLRSMFGDDLEKPAKGKRRREPEQALEDPSGGASGGGSKVPTVKLLAEHPLIRGGVQKPTTEAQPPEHPSRWDKLQARMPWGLRERFPKRRDFPSYLKPRTFSLVMLDTLTGGPTAEPGEAAKSEDLFKKASEAAAIVPGPTGVALRTLVEEARGDVDRFRENLESWYDDTMTRVSGWYRRKVQVSLWVIAILVTLAMNADSLQVGRSLWQDDALRASVVAQAQKQVRDGASTGSVTESVTDVKQLELPLGWSFERADPRWPDSFLGFVGKFFGLAVTAVALSLGAPFWFDLMGKVSRVRGTGKPERSEKGD
jgi:hypothetical protein